MSKIRRARLVDVEVVASWLHSDVDCRRWAGRRVSFPVDLALLPRTIEWEASESWCVISDGSMVAFGQIVPKPERRLHLARLIVAPERRGQGFGRLLAAHLLNTALARRPTVVSLNVAHGNDPAIDLYRSLDFVDADGPPDEPASPSVYMEHRT